MKKYLLTTLASGVLFALSVGVASAASLVTNGSFETGTAPGTYLTVNAGDSSTITGWTVQSGSVDYIGTYWQAADGSRSLDLSGNEAGASSQSISTVPGESYQVTFDLSGNPDGTRGVKTVEVSATGAAAQDYTYDTAAEGNTLGNMKWQSESYTFTATSNSTTLAFTSLVNSPYGPALDNVAMVPVCTSTIDGTAAVVASTGQTVSGTIDATGCDIGVYAGSGINSVTVTAIIHDANKEGVMADGATNVSVTGSTVYNIGSHIGSVYTPNGAQNGNGIRFQGNATGSVTSNDVYAYEKNGIAITHGSSATVNGNTVTGAGPVSYIAANGIEFYNGASGSIMNNTVKDNYCTYNNAGDNCTGNPTSDAHADGAAGILIYGPSSASVTVSGNTLTGNQYSIWSVGSTALDVTGNNIMGTGGATDSGVAIWNADQWGLAPTTDTTGSIDHNVISGTSYAVMLEDYQASGSNQPAMTVNRNDISGGSADGLWTNITSHNTDGTCNWWGAASGPSSVGSGSGSHVTVGVNYTPWLTSSNLSGECDGGLPPTTITIHNRNTGTVTVTTVSNSNSGGNTAGGSTGGSGGRGGSARNFGGGGSTATGGNGGSAGSVSGSSGGFVSTGSATSNSGSLLFVNTNITRATSRTR